MTDERRAIAHKIVDSTWDDYIRYCCRLERLQEYAGLTFREAKVYLFNYECIPEIPAVVFGISRENYNNIRRRAYRKVQDSGYTEAELFKNCEWEPVLY